MSRLLRTLLHMHELCTDNEAERRELYVNSFTSYAFSIKFLHSYGIEFAHTFNVPMLMECGKVKVLDNEVRESLSVYTMWSVSILWP
jgi:hypothetical protein